MFELAPEENTQAKKRWTRRGFIAISATAIAAPMLPAWATVTQTAERKLSFVHTHTAEKLTSITYFRDGRYVPTALTSLNHLLRDFRNDTVHEIDPALFDILYELQVCADCDKPYEIVSGYRSPETNRMLHERSNGVASHSLHMEGKAIDIRIPGYSCKKLQGLALALKRGGVGYYASSNFVHVDTGRVRSW